MSLTNEELAAEITSRDASEFKEMIETISDAIFDTYNNDDLDTIGQAFADNKIDTKGICDLKRPN